MLEWFLKNHDVTLKTGVMAAEKISCAITGINYYALKYIKIEQLF